jgi:hypothetical protein
MDSYVETNAEGLATTFVGPDATELFRAMALRGALGMWATHKIIPTRGVTITRMLKMTSEITQKPYKRGEARAAARDLTTWIDAMKAAMPIVRG